MIKFFSLLTLVLFSSCFAECPLSSAEILVMNDSPYKLRLETKEEETCKLHFIADVLPATKKKYFCILHDYLLKVTTYYKDKRMAILATDTWNDITILASGDSFDVKVKHFRGGESLIKFSREKDVQWHHHEHDSKKHDTRNKDHSTESLLD